MKKGQIFDLYQDGKPTVRVMAISSDKAINLDTLGIITDIDFDNEVMSIIIEDIFSIN